MNTSAISLLLLLFASTSATKMSGSYEPGSVMKDHGHETTMKIVLGSSDIKETASKSGTACMS